MAVLACVSALAPVSQPHMKCPFGAEGLCLVPSNGTLQVLAATVALVLCTAVDVTLC
jgi:hypothetical protein